MRPTTMNILCAKSCYKKYVKERGGTNLSGTQHNNSEWTKISEWDEVLYGKITTKRE